jgi:hypothetical protein
VTTPTHVARARKKGWLLAGGLVLFMGFVVYRSLRVAGYSCTACIAFRGQAACRTVEGPTEHEARASAINNVCALLAAGVTDTLACERTTPTKVECAALN